MYWQTRSNCFRLMMAPMSVASSSGSPISKRLELCGQLVEEGFEDRAVEEQPRPRGARLPLAREAHPRNHAVDRARIVGVREDDRGTLAAELERDRHDAVRRRVHDELADLGRSGERQLADERMPRQRGAAFLAVAGQQVHDAWRQVFVAQLRDAQQSERRVLGGLQHQRIARRHRHRDLERAEHDRGVPRHDAADDADRFASRVAEDVLTERAPSRPSPRRRRRRNSGGRRPRS